MTDETDLKPTRYKPFHQRKSEEVRSHEIFEVPEAPEGVEKEIVVEDVCLLYTSPSPRDQRGSRMPSSA